MSIDPLIRRFDPGSYEITELTDRGKSIGVTSKVAKISLKPWESLLKVPT